MWQFSQRAGLVWTVKNDVKLDDRGDKEPLILIGNVPCTIENNLWGPVIEQN